MSDTDIFLHIIRLQTPGNKHWSWCCDTLKIGTWKMRTGITGSAATYCFINEQDLLAFKLRFGV